MEAYGSNDNAVQSFITEKNADSMRKMPRESQRLDYKSIRKIIGSTAYFVDLAQDCVCFANSIGGTLLLGIEDNQNEPPENQQVEPALLERIRKRVGELTVNVQVLTELKQHNNGGEDIVFTVPRAVGVASTSNGRYFLRVGDTCRPVVGDDVMRLANERPAIPWEEMISQDVPRSNADPSKAKQSSCVRTCAPRIGLNSQ